MEREKDNRTTARRPDCVTETRMGNTVLVVSVLILISRTPFRENVS